jgi:hypothetical protein
VVYTRSVNGEELTLGVSGKLYKDALVMFDRQTRSLSTQVDGSVLRGKMKGARLAPVPAVQTTWGQWKRMHPDTLVLKKESRSRGSAYDDYHDDPDQMGIAETRNPDSRLPGKTLVVSLRDGEEALAISLKALRKELVYETEFGGVPLVVVFNPPNATARVFDRRVQGETLSFNLQRRGPEVILMDEQTSTLWSGLTGKARKGKLAGQELRPVPHMVNYWFAWAAYNPRTRVEP